MKNLGLKLAATVSLVLLALVPASQTSAADRPDDTLANTCSCVTHR